MGSNNMFPPALLLMAHGLWEFICQTSSQSICFASELGACSPLVLVLLSFLLPRLYESLHSLRGGHTHSVARALSCVLWSCATCCPVVFWSYCHMAYGCLMVPLHMQGRRGGEFFFQAGASVRECASCIRTHADISAWTR